MSEMAIRTLERNKNPKFIPIINFGIALQKHHLTEGFCARHGSKNSQHCPIGSVKFPLIRNNFRKGTKWLSKPDIQGMISESMQQISLLFCFPYTPAGHDHRVRIIQLFSRLLLNKESRNKQTTSPVSQHLQQHNQHHIQRSGIEVRRVDPSHVKSRALDPDPLKLVVDQEPDNSCFSQRSIKYFQ